MLDRRFALVLSRWLHSQQYSTFPFSSFILIMVIIVCSSSISEVCLVLPLKPVSSTGPVVLPCTMHSTCKKVANIVRSVWKLHCTSSFYQIGIILINDLSFVANTISKLYLYFYFVFEILFNTSFLSFVDKSYTTMSALFVELRFLI